MSSNAEWATTGRREVPAAFRSGEEIGLVLARIDEVPDDCSALSRQRVLTVLDDLAEEMIGRTRPGDPSLKQQIAQHRQRFRR